jgi:hypothetical protein
VSCATVRLPTVLSELITFVVTFSNTGHSYQLRALDFDTTGPFKDYPQITVYHPSEGHAYAQVLVFGHAYNCFSVGSAFLRCDLASADICVPPLIRLRSPHPLPHVTSRVLTGGLARQHRSPLWLQRPAARRLRDRGTNPIVPRAFAVCFLVSKHATCNTVHRVVWVCLLLH